MISPKRDRVPQLDEGLNSYSEKERRLPGIETPIDREALLERVSESVWKIENTSGISRRNFKSSCADPSHDDFHPLKAAVLCHREGRFDDAFWLVFLSVHFGENRTAGWRLARDVYGGLGGCGCWDWDRINSDPGSFTKWLADAETPLRNDGVSRPFGNHRKHESLDTSATAIESYVNWLRPLKTHRMLVQEAEKNAGRDPRKMFDWLYRSMKISVEHFGRLATFDYLATVGELGLARVEPGSPYLPGSTGPLRGARLLFGEASKRKSSRRRLMVVW